MSRARVAVLTVAAALALAACTSSGDDSPDSSAAPAPTTAPATSTSPTPAPTESAAPDTAASSPASSTPASSGTPSPAPSGGAPAFTTTCSKLTVQVIPGGAIRGAEIAALQYVNAGTDACTITGVPSAVLLRGGTVVGTPSRSNGKPARAFTLQPGEVGESLLRDFSTCNAPLADSIRVTTPVRGGSSATSVHPAKLRACTIELAPVGAPA